MTEVVDGTVFNSLTEEAEHRNYDNWKVNVQHNNYFFTLTITNWNLVRK